MTRRSFVTPNAKRATEERWRADMIVRAIGALTIAGGALPGKVLATWLGVSPRGLRPIFTGHPEIQPEIRGAEGERGEPWYRLELKALPAPMMVPPLLGGPELEP